ncbi:MAG: hypothetical protein ABI651_08265 [Verrucomicrobiota bacterium]
MSDKTYVCVANIGVADAFDKKYKSTLPKLIKATTENAINRSSKLTTKAPPDKNEKGFYLEGNLNSLMKTAKGNRIVIGGKMTMQLATWPDKRIFATSNTGAKLETSESDNIDDAVEDAVKEILGDLLPKVIPVLEKEAP